MLRHDEILRDTVNLSFDCTLQQRSKHA